jgi:hypothetical protein
MRDRIIIVGFRAALLELAARELQGPAIEMHERHEGPPLEYETKPSEPRRRDWEQRGRYRGKKELKMRRK